jgi:23S rRNA (guanosine2251-2'-O)-methyltransferase
MSRDRDRRHRRSPRPPDPSVVAGRRSVAEAIRAGKATEVLVVSSPKATQGMRSVLDAAGAAGVPVRVVDRSRLDVLARDHQGVVATTQEPAGVTEALGERELGRFPFDDDAVVVLLDGIVDPQNLGAAARTAEAAGAAMLVNRTRRAADATPAAIRASAGALLHLPYARVPNIARAIERLHDAGFWVVGLDADAPVEIGDEPCPHGRVAVVIGNEGTGLTRLVRERCDALIALPMRGQVASLNASASLAALLYAWVLPSRDATVPPRSGR